jgi:hypothetical protein
MVKMLHGRNFMEVILFRHACPILLLAASDLCTLFLRFQA